VPIRVPNLSWGISRPPRVVFGIMRATPGAWCQPCIKPLRPSATVLTRLCQEYLRQPIFCWSSHQIFGSRRHSWQRRVSTRTWRQLLLVNNLSFYLIYRSEVSLHFGNVSENKVNGDIPSPSLKSCLPYPQPHSSIYASFHFTHCILNIRLKHGPSQACAIESKSLLLPMK